MTEQEFANAVGELVERADGLGAGFVSGVLIAHAAAAGAFSLGLDEATAMRMAQAAIDGMRVIATAARATRESVS